jgi:hypothetical protein
VTIFVPVVVGTVVVVGAVTVNVVDFVIVGMPRNDYGVWSQSQIARRGSRPDGEV